MQALSTYTITARLSSNSGSAESPPGERLVHRVGADGSLGSYYRALSASGEPQILFLLNREPPGPAELAHLQQIYDLQSAIFADRAAKQRSPLLQPLAIVHGELRLGLALRHAEGEPLTAALRRGRLGLPTALQVGILLADLMGELHQRGMLYGPCSPEHLLLESSATGGAATPENERAYPATVLSLIQALPLGSAPRAPRAPMLLRYAAPEQLSSSAVLAESADLYSLGVLMYQMLCGTPPYDSEDPAELVHAHLARRPQPLDQRLNSVPPVLARIIDKLLAKVPAERYLTARGLRSDLMRVAEQQRNGQPADFELDSSDHGQRLALSLPRDARIEEEQALQAAWLAACRGQQQAVILAGAMGSGKTLVVQRLRGPVRAAQGLFVEVRCAQADRAPHAVLAQMLRELSRQLLQEPVERLAPLRRELVQNLGPGAQALSVLSPEIDVLLEGAPKAPALEGGPAYNRLRFLLSQFLRTVARPERPLVLFCDDAHFIDAGSLRLLTDCLAAAPALPVLWVATLRTGDADAVHPLAAALGTLRAAGIVVAERQLPPLTLVQLRALLTSTLGYGDVEAAPLADVLHVKTHGNLLMLGQLLRTLQDDGLLRRDGGSERWVHDLEAIIGHAAGADAQPVLVQRIGRLSADAQRSLALAACLGPEFSLGALAALTECDPLATRVVLSELVGSGLIHRDVDAAAEPQPPGGSADPGNDRYRFVHSSVLEAAAARLDEAEQARTHLRIGYRLLGSAPESQPDRVLLAGVQQLNRGASQLADAAARRHLAELNLRAGRRAKAAAANEAAAELFRFALTLLPDSPAAAGWTEQGAQELAALELALQRELIDSEFLCGRLPAADARAQSLRARARSPLEQAQVQALRARYHLPAGRYKDAVQLGLQALSLLGIEFPSDEAQLQAQAEAQLAALGEQLVQLGPEALLALPVSQDPAHRLCMNLVGLLLPPSFASRPALFQALVAFALSALQQHGNTEESCIAFFSYGLLQVTTGDIPRGLMLSELAQQLYQRLNVHRTAGMVMHVHGGHINHWARPLHTSVPILAQSIQTSMAVGDLNHIGNGVFEMVWLLHERGDRLDEVERYAAHALDLAGQIRNEAVRSAVLSCQSYVRCLRAEPGPLGEQPGDRFVQDTAAALQRLTQASFGPGIGTYHTLHLILRYLFGQYAEAYAAAQAAAPLLRQIQSLPIEVALHLFRGLTLVQRLAEVGDDAGLGALLEQDLQKLQRWAAACPYNYAPLSALLRAEVARLRGQPLLAEALYDEAIEGARHASFVHYAALANELAARFYAQRGRRLIAPTYLRAAHLGYAMLGAHRKAAQLAALHPELQAGTPFIEPTTQSSPLREALSVAAVVRLGQAMAAELRLDQVVEQLLRIALHHAGATRGALLLLHEGALQLVAHSRQGADGEVVVVSGLMVPLGQTQQVPPSLIQEVAATASLRVLADASSDPHLGTDACVLGNKSRSIVALPLLHRSQVSGVLYLENSLSPNVFHGERLEVLGCLCAQAATAVENAQLYARLSRAGAELKQANERLEREVEQQTNELRKSNEQLAQELARRIQTEQARAALQEEVIHFQSTQLAELSTPLVPVAESIMVMPLLGAIDAKRAQDIIETVLQQAQDSRTRVVIIDVTGLRRIDDVAVSLLMRAPRALRLLGSQAILTGMRPDMAKAMVAMGADLSTVKTRADLRSGIDYALELVKESPRR